MKRPQPDLSEALRDDLIGNLKTVRGLLRLWGTETVGGVEVFTRRQYYHKESDRSDNFKKLFKFLGSYEDVNEGTYEGVRNAWLYFNKNKGSELGINYQDYVANNLNKMWWNPNDGVIPENLTLTTSIVIQSYSPNDLSRDRIYEIINTGMTKTQAIASIKANYDELWDLGLITQEGVGVINKGSIQDPVYKISVPDEDDLSPDDPWLNTIARHALKRQGIPCTIKDLAIGTIQRRTEDTYNAFFSTFVIDIEIPYKEFFNTDQIVIDIAGTLESTSRSVDVNSYNTNVKLRGMSSSDIENDLDLVTRDYDLWENQITISDSVADVLWYEHLGTWYLRAAPFRNPKEYGFKFSQLNDYILGLIDSDYKKKKVPFYKKAIAVILVVIAIVIIIISAGKAVKLATKLLIVATGILTLSLVLTLLTLAFSVLGMNEWASAFMSVSKAIEPLVMIATIVAIVAAPIVAAQKAAEKAGEAYIKKSVYEIVVDFLKSQTVDIVDNIIKGAADVFTGNVATEVAMVFNRKMLELVNLGAQIKLQSLQGKNKDLKAEYDKLVEEASRETDSLQAFSRIYNKPATADWSMYAAEFDLPYERGGGNLHLGNIQRTTKQALRKADYDDSAFAGIFIV
jgi:hypothetical protein